MNNILLSDTNIPDRLHDVPNEIKDIIVWYTIERSFGLTSLLPARRLNHTLNNCLGHIKFDQLYAPDHVIDRCTLIDCMTRVCSNGRKTTSTLARLWTTVPIKRVHHRLRKILLTHVKTLRKLASVNREWYSLISNYWKPVYDEFRAFDSWWVSHRNPLYLDQAPVGAPSRWYELAFVLTMFRPRQETFWQIPVTYEEKKKFEPFWRIGSFTYRTFYDCRELENTRRAQEHVRSIVKRLEEERFLSVLISRKLSMKK